MKKKGIIASVNKKQKQLTKHYIILTMADYNESLIIVGHVLTYLNDILSSSQLKDNKKKNKWQAVQSVSKKQLLIQFTKSLLDYSRVTTLPETP